MTATPPLMEAIACAMRHMELRQRIVAENIANADTPHFRARTVAPQDFGHLLSTQLPVATARQVARPQVMASEAMVALGASRPRDAGVSEDKDTSETKPDGNSVVLEDQILDMGEIRADFTALTNLYRKQLSLLNIAIGRGG